VLNVINLAGIQVNAIAQTVLYQDSVLTHLATVLSIMPHEIKLINARANI